jgi:hypothetical protein
LVMDGILNGKNSTLENGSKVPRNLASWKFDAKFFLQCLVCWPKFSIELSQTQPLPKRNSNVNSKSFSNIPGTWFNFIMKLAEMGKLIHSGNEVINLCELLRPTFKL